MSKMTIFLCLYLLGILFPVLLPGTTDQGTATPTTGNYQFDSDGNIYTYENTFQTLRIFNAQNRTVFRTTCNNDDTIILAPGRSRSFHSFYVFKETFDPSFSSYSLYMDFKKFIIPIVENSASAFYCPLLAETEDGNYVLFTTNKFTTVVYSLDTKSIFMEIESTVPVRLLDIVTIDGRAAVRCLKFVDGQYVEHYLFLSAIKTGNAAFIQSQSTINYQNGNYVHGKSQATTNDSLAVTILDAAKITCFGDSITYGYVSREPAPEKGYIPKLLPKLQELLYEDTELFNEGDPGSQTWEAIGRIDTVLHAHNSGYLLFHYGTNDVIHPDQISAEEVLFNIRYMIDKTIAYGTQPLLSTLIPRNGRLGQGIFLERALEICAGIRSMASTLNLHCIDLWDIYFNYPVADGGYESLMSDGVHPSEAGYQVMCREWLASLLAFPPPAPGAIHQITYINANRCSVSWIPNRELDVNGYEVIYGFSATALTRIISADVALVEFLYLPLYYPQYRNIFFKIRAVDKAGNAGVFSPVNKIVFK